MNNLDEIYFKDEGICEQSICMIQHNDGSITNGIVMFLTPENPEILLTYEELKSAVRELEIDIKCNQHIYKR